VCAGDQDKARVYESGTSEAESSQKVGPATVLEIWLAGNNEVRYVMDGNVFHTTITKSVSWPVHVAAVVNAVQVVAFDQIQYVTSLPPAPPMMTNVVASPSPPGMASPPPPLPPGDYVAFDGGAHDHLVAGRGMVGRVSGTAGWNAAAWSEDDIWSAEDARKGISFQCPLNVGAKMIGFINGGFAKTSSYTALAFAIYCARMAAFPDLTTGRACC
jgi:hypothetical protein